MNKTEFIKELNDCLRHLPKEDREDAISYYEEYLGDMEINDYEDVTVKLGTPKEVAKSIIENCTAKAVEEQKENRSLKGSGKVVWLVILGIFSLPLSLPFAITVFALALTLAVLVFTLLLVLGVVGVALAVGAVIGFFKAFFLGGIASIIVGIGVSFMMAGIGILAVVGTVELCKAIAGLMGRIFSKKHSTND